MKTLLAGNLWFWLALASTLTIPRTAEARDLGILDTLGDNIVTQVVCQDIREVRDDGLSVVIQTGGFAGITTAVISRLTFAGSQHLRSVPVERAENSGRHPGLVAYSGEKFRLLINTAEMRDGYSPARLKAIVADRILTEELICRLVK